MKGITILAAVAALTLTSCVSSSDHDSSSNDNDTFSSGHDDGLAAQDDDARISQPVVRTPSKAVIDRMPGYDQTPSWVHKGKRFTIEGNRVAFVGFLTMSADASTIDRCAEMAGVDAKGKLASSIASDIIAQSGITGDEKTTDYSRLTSAIAHQHLPGVEVANTYSQLVRVDDGDSVTKRFECWGEVTISKNVLRHAVARAVNEFDKDVNVTQTDKHLVEHAEQEALDFEAAH